MDVEDIKLLSGWEQFHELKFENPEGFRMFRDPNLNGEILFYKGGYAKTVDLQNHKTEMFQRKKEDRNVVYIGCKESGICGSNIHCSNHYSISHNCFTDTENKIFVDDRHTNTSFNLLGHTNTVTCIRIFKENIIVSSSLDKTIKIWDLENREMILNIITKCEIFQIELSFYMTYIIAKCTENGITFSVIDLGINNRLKAKDEIKHMHEESGSYFSYDFLCPDLYNLILQKL